MRHTCELGLVMAAAMLGACAGGDPDGGNDTDDTGDATRAVSAVPLTSPDGSFWGPEVTLGSQTFVMDLDTGSTTVAIAGSGCGGCASAGVSPLYAPSKSATDEDDFAIQRYEDNSGWEGHIWKDGVKLGNGTPSVAINVVDIGLQYDFFTDNSYQGILGMGSPDNARPDTGAYMTTAAKDGVAPIVAFELCDTTGTMWLGGYDASYAAAAAAYTPLLKITTDDAFYSINIDSMSIGDVSVGSGSDTFEQPVVDTGTTLFYVPTGVDKAVLAAINASPGYQALFGTKKLKDNGCVTATGVTAAMVDAQLPSLTMTMPAAGGGADVSLTVAPMLSYLYDGGNGQFCYAMGDGGTDQATTMGDTILRAFVSVIDLKAKRVGWAPDAGCGTEPRAAIEPSTFRPHPPRRRAHS